MCVLARHVIEIFLPFEGRLSSASDHFCQEVNIHIPCLEMVIARRCLVVVAGLDNVKVLTQLPVACVIDRTSFQVILFSDDLQLA